MNINHEADRVREEHRKVSQLAERLQQRVAVAPRGDVRRWADELSEEFERFRAHLLKHMAMEERDGYLVSVARVRPTLSPKLAKLRHEHRELEELLRDLHDRLGRLGDEDRLLARDWCSRAIDLLHYIEHHEDEENDLVEIVFTQDIGSKD